MRPCSSETGQKSVFSQTSACWSLSLQAFPPRQLNPPGGGATHRGTSWGFTKSSSRPLGYYRPNPNQKLQRKAKWSFSPALKCSDSNKLFCMFFDYSTLFNIKVYPLLCDFRWRLDWFSACNKRPLRSELSIFYVYFIITMLYFWHALLLQWTNTWRIKYYVS